jgi:hypothetical protein
MSPPDTVGARRPTRRAVLKAALVGGAIAVVGGVAGWLRTRGYDRGEAPPTPLQSLSLAQYVLVQHVARRIAAPDDPADARVVTADVADVAGFVDGYVARMDTALRRDLERLFVYVEHVAPFRFGLTSRFTQLAPDAQDRVLASLEASDIDLLRGGFVGLKSLVFMGYYRDPRTWAQIGYAGPTVNRPDGGFW